MAESYSLLVSASCATSLPGSGVLTVQMEYVAGGVISPEQPTMLYLLDGGGVVLRSQGGERNTTVDFSSLGNGTYGLRWEESDTGALLATGGATLTCPPGGVGSLVLDSLTHTNETAAGASDGTATIQGSGGLNPLTALLVETGATQPATNGAAVTFTGLAPGPHTVRLADSASGQVEGVVEVLAYAEPISGCRDEYASDYNPAATVNASCAYAIRWRSAWGPARMAVQVAAQPGQNAAYLSASLRIGFRPGHPLAALRPLSAPLQLRATVGPDGYATFRLAPYLQRALGAPDGLGGYRLDLNSAEAYSSDLFVGYELRRGGQLLEHGYALNAAVPDAEIGALTPFAGRVPVWPGFDTYQVAYTSEISASRYGLIESDQAFQFNSVRLPCPANPLPVAWLAPGGGFGYWVFQHRPVLADEVAEGQTFNEALTGERRYSQRGESRRTVAATSGEFKGLDLLEGLRTLAASTQVWYQPVLGGPWVPVTVATGNFPAGRMGVVRQQVSISFTEASARYAQGQ